MKVSDSSTYLEAAALKGETAVTIESVRPIGKDDKGLDGRPMNKKNVVISYKNATKPHVVCRTAQKQIRAALAAEHGGGEHDQIAEGDTGDEEEGDREHQRRQQRYSRHKPRLHQEFS